MKGRTTCPKCKHEFIMDVLESKEINEIICPKCCNIFTVQIKCPDTESKDECSWVEHGEPRKTVLSSIKPKTKRPMIATILLICVFLVGITTAVFSEAFIDSSMNLASNIGFTGSIEILVIDQFNNSLKNINVTIDDITGKTNENGIFFVENVKPGIQTLKLSTDGYKKETQELLVTPIFDFKGIVEMKAGVGEGKKIFFDATGCILVLAIFSVFALLSAITCLKLRHLDVAIVGSLIGILSLGFFFIGSILSIIAFFLIIKSREEFENGRKGKIF